MNRNKLIEAILKNTKMKLKPSCVCDGVGLFAIEDIKKGQELFPDLNPDKDYITWVELNDLGLNAKEYLARICNSDTEGIFISRTPNQINISYYVNHSDNPNVIHNKELDTFIALKDIKAEEELLCTYDKEDQDW